MADVTLAVRIETDEDEEDIEVSGALVNMLAEGDQGPSEVLADLVLFGLAQRAHAAVHHSEGETDETLADAEEQTMAQFEERFGMTYGEATGHLH